MEISLGFLDSIKIGARPVKANALGTPQNFLLWHICRS